MSVLCKPMRIVPSIYEAEGESVIVLVRNTNEFFV